MAPRSTKSASRKRSRKKTKQPSTEAPGLVPLKIVVDPSEEEPSFYVNYVEVTCSQNEFALLGCLVPTKLSQSKIQAAQEADGNLRIEPEVKVLIPTTIIHGLIKALQSQVTVYEETFGTLNKTEGGYDGE